MNWLRILVVSTAIHSAAYAPADELLKVLQTTADGIATEKQLELWLKRECYKHIDARSAAFEKMLKSKSACREWQADRRRFFLEQIGGLPERTPLHPLVVGKLSGRGYRVEKLILESRPGFHITANLYLPESPPPWPAVLVPCGHSHEGKAVGQYQRVCILLARNGMAAMCYDPIGQGERYQMLDLSRSRTAFEDAPHVPTPHPNVRYMCTTEHTMIAVSSALIGANVAQYRIWDGMRVIDYLQSRPDIRADRIGCTGNSGGGTETAYLMALDDRITAAAPGCYLTTFRRLIDTKGPQDGEQNIFGQIAFGMDEADYCILRAPRPTLIGAGTRDATFDFRGTWNLFLDAKRFYSRVGVPERMEIAAPDAPHGFTLPLREATARFMHRWLIGGDKLIREVDELPDSLTDEQLRSYNEPDWTPQQLQCTPQGQVLLMPQERSAFQINADLARDLRDRRTDAWRRLDDAGKRRVVGDVIDVRPPADPIARSLQTLETIDRGHYRIQKLALTVEDGLQLPALAFIPKDTARSVTLYLHNESMAADAGESGPILKLVRNGHLVLAAELRGIGETDTGRGKSEFGKGRFGRDNLEIFLAYLLGKSYVGMRTGDVSAWAQCLREGRIADREFSKVDLVAIGEAAIPALHAAALEPNVYGLVSSRGMIRSWEEIVGATETYDQWVNVVHGALQNYDLPDLLPLIPGKVELDAPTDAAGRELR
ncbi:MAG: hypothetical protein JNL96_05475 [Planctomycetaceae bacterium]|nr:hypothetical protein [Planctomycetaceae bacterium]